jgi:hypothetical protein
MPPRPDERIVGRGNECWRLLPSGSQERYIKVTLSSRFAASLILAAFSVAPLASAQDNSVAAGTGAATGTISPAPPTKAEQAAKKASL